MGENKYLYADKAQQIKRANWIAMVCFLIFIIGDAAIVAIATVRGYRSYGEFGMVVALSVISVLAEELIRRNEKLAKYTPYAILASLVVLGFIVTLQFDSYYVRFVASSPIVVFVIYYDTKLMISAVISMGIMQIITTAAKFIFGSTVSLVDITGATIVVIFILIMTYLIERNGKLFQTHMLGRLQEEKDNQEKVMQDVIYVASEVRKGTQGAMDIMKELNDSTNVVTGAVRDISDSTQSTAENIQQQTEMTQSIQDAIENTIERSERMVGIAEKSKEMNNENLSIMNDIKNQSHTISETNANVAKTMETLQERANAVKGIADTIFAISSQTNLLALNASIESARAGEAGRGFAVVADEIRQLAEKTRTETETIANILDELSENAEQAVGAVANSVEATEQQDALIAKAAESFEAMNAQVGELTENIQEIDSMLIGLSQANNRIVDSITHLSATTQQVTASSAQAEDLSNRNLENADSTKDILDQVLSVSQQLDKYVQE